MSIYDILMLSVLLAATLFGFWKGFAWQVASFLSVCASYIVAANFWPHLAPRIQVEPPLNEYIAMLILFLATGLAIWILFGAVRKTIERMQLNAWDRQAGMLLGALKGALLCMVVTLFAVTMLGDNQRATIINSPSGRIITLAIDRAAGAVPEHMRASISSYLEAFDREVEEHYDPQARPPAQSLNEIVEGIGWGNSGNTEPNNERTYTGQVTSTGETQTGGMFYDSATGAWTRADGTPVDPRNVGGTNDWNSSGSFLEGMIDSARQRFENGMRNAVRDELNGNR